MRWTTLVFAVLTIALAAGVAEASVFRTDLPADSPYWWTLTDDLTPQELKAQHSDRNLVALRHAEAMRVGRRGPLPREQERRLTTFYEPSENPELTPMWRAFDVFAKSYLLNDGEDTTYAALADYEVSSEGISAILAIAYTQIGERDRIASEITAGTQEFVEVQRRLVESHGKGTLQAALRGHNYRLLAEACQCTEDHVAEILAAWRTDPAASSATEAISSLKGMLGGEDWGKLQRYLLEVVSSGMGTLMDIDYFDPEEGDR